MSHTAFANELFTGKLFCLRSVILFSAVRVAAPFIDPFLAWNRSLFVVQSPFIVAGYGFFNGAAVGEWFGR
jgi:hypothetical protein